VEAKLTRDTEFFGKMDPFAVIDYRNERFKTVVKQDAGKVPVWNQTFKFDIKYIGDDMVFKVFDEDVTENEAIGAFQTKVSAFARPGGLDEWFTLTFKGKSAGQLHVKSNWIPAGGAPQQQMAPQQQQMQ
jgi:Ca2+-dependent lipid-binding protein